MSSPKWNFANKQDSKSCKDCGTFKFLVACSKYIPDVFRTMERFAVNRAQAQLRYRAWFQWERDMPEMTWRFTGFLLGIENYFEKIKSIEYKKTYKQNILMITKFIFFLAKHTIMARINFPRREGQGPWCPTSLYQTPKHIPRLDPHAYHDAEPSQNKKILKIAIAWFNLINHQIVVDADWIKWLLVKYPVFNLFCGWQTSPPTILEVVA